MLQIPGEPLLGPLYGGLDFEPDGHLWLTYRPPPIIPPPPDPVHRIDLATGTVTDFPNQYGYGPFAIAPASGSCGGEPPPIPAVSPLGLLLLAGGLAAAGGLFLASRRRRLGSRR